MVASWYCWYSDTKSFMLDSASVNSISSMPSPVYQCLPPEHGGELLGDPLEQLLDGGGVPDEGGGHLQSSWRNVADSRLDVVRDPLHEVGRVFVLNIEHLLVHLLHR